MIGTVGGSPSAWRAASAGASRRRRRARSEGWPRQAAARRTAGGSPPAPAAPEAELREGGEGREILERRGIDDVGERPLSVEEEEDAVQPSGIR